MTRKRDDQQTSEIPAEGFLEALERGRPGRRDPGQSDAMLEQELVAPLNLRKRAVFHGSAGIGVRGPPEDPWD